MRTPIDRKSLVLVAIVVAAGLCGCADLQRATAPFAPAGVNVESPVAAAVVAAQTGPVPEMDFRDVPPKPDTTAELTPFQRRRVVESLARSGDDVTAWANDNPVMAPDSTAAFNAASLKALRYNPNDLPPEDQAARTDAYVAQLRAKAAAPPPPH